MDSAEAREESDCRDSLRKMRAEEGALEASLSLMPRDGLGVGLGRKPAACRSDEAGQHER